MIGPNNIEYAFYIDKLYVKQYETCPNAVARVLWACVMKRNGATIVGGGQTDLPAPVAEGFIDIANLEAQQVLDWVLATEGGEPWLSAYLSGHEALLAEAEKNSALQPWKIPLVNPLKFDPSNV